MANSFLRRTMAVLGATALSFGLATAAHAQPAPTITWEECPPQVGEQNAQCGRIDVPREYDGSPETISVGFVKVPAAQPSARRGALFMNPGGPGQDAYSMVNPQAFLWPEAMRAEWDLVAVQPRGLAGSTPLECTEMPPGWDPVRIATQQGGFIKASCDITQPGLVHSLTTNNTAEDLERVRQALGYGTVSLFGLSYGTNLMSTYATKYPQHVDKVVLDSGYNPSLAWNGVIGNQHQHYVASLHEFLGWVAANNDTYHLGTTPLAVYQAWSARVVAESGTNPTVVPPPATIDDLPPGLRIAGQPAADVLTAVGGPRVQLEGLFTQATRPGALQAHSPTLAMTRVLLPQPSAWPALARLITGEETIPAASPEQMEAAGQSQVMQRMVICNENTVAPRYDQLPAFLWSNYVTGEPFQASHTLFSSGAACSGLAPHTAQIPLSGAHLKHRPLQIQGTRDPQAPYGTFGELSQAMGSHVITVDGPGHAQVGVGNRALDDVVVDYLRTGSTEVTAMPGRPVELPRT